MRDILISGYYGFKNSGDDALLLAIINDLKECKDDIKLSVLSKSPKETAEFYNVKAVNRLNPFSVVFNIIRSKMLLSGGGTLIQDRTSTKSLLYYLAIINLAHLFGKKIMLYSNGIGPLREEHREITAKILNKVDVITLRDEDSLREIERLKVNKPKIVLTADPAFNLECSDKAKGDRILKKYGLSENDKKVCISVRNWKTLGENFCAELAKTADYLVHSCGCKVIFLPMQPSKDLAVSNKIAAMMTEKSVCVDEKISVDDMLAIIDKMDLCIGMRLHSLIYSASAKIPVIGLVYDPKIAGFMDYIGQTHYTDVSECSFEHLKKMIDECFESYDAIKAEIEKNLTELKKKAKANAEYAVGLLCSGKEKKQ